jgi:hypothetical protein
MAIFLSDLMTNGALPFQGTYGGSESSITGVVKIPSGTVIADNSQLKIARFATFVNIEEILIRTNDLDAGTTLSMSVGYARPTEDPALALDATTNPAVTGAVAADSLAYYAATATAPYQAGGVIRYVLGQSGLDNEFANNPTDGVDGLIDLCLVATEPAASATVADGYVWVTIKYTGKTQVPGTFSGSDAYDYNSAY